MDKQPTIFEEVIKQSPELRRAITSDGKLNYGQVVMSLTHACNIRCAHCLRGDADNANITKEAIDAFLDTAQQIDQLTLSGGEPFLQPDLIDYVVDGCIKRNIWLDTFLVITNGTIQSKQIADAFTRMSAYLAHRWKMIHDADPAKWAELNKYSPERVAKESTALLITQDHYHTEAGVSRQQRKDTVKYYIDNTENVRCAIRDDDKEAVRALSRRGRAKTLNDEGTLDVEPMKPHRIEIDPIKNKVLAQLNIDIDGNVYTQPPENSTDPKRNPPLMNVLKDKDTGIAASIINWNLQYPWSDVYLGFEQADETTYNEIRKYRACVELAILEGRADEEALNTVDETRFMLGMLQDLYKDSKKHIKKALSEAAQTWKYLGQRELLQYIDELEPLVIEIYLPREWKNIKRIENEKEVVYQKPVFADKEEIKQQISDLRVKYENENMNKYKLIKAIEPTAPKIIATLEGVEREAYLAAIWCKMGLMTTEELMTTVCSALYPEKSLQEGEIAALTGEIVANLKEAVGA